ncbi:transposase [Streptomyces sp. NBRC 110611]|uniref:transposase n=1 Tax=Streptomyces sp. NBRC 110611 TaxID=1621259 RepID=UPI000855BA3C|nr:transposase [Streptomyces sp. NBRC 110611]GAU71506.1 transposase [Streptomyces sp. NBRC 110611]
MPRQVARWIATTPSQRGLHATEGLHRLFEHCPELERTHDLVRQFAAMLDNRDAAGLTDWLDHLTASNLPALASLAKAIREDQAAVVQGITTPFNSGVNEGRITDLKLQKRITAGRAGVPLLRQRVIFMANPDAAIRDGVSPAHGGTPPLHEILARAREVRTPTPSTSTPRTKVGKGSSCEIVRRTPMCLSRIRIGR